VLERRTAGSPWQTAALVSAGPFAVPVAPLQAVDYRLRSATVTGQPVRLAVVPLVSAAASPDGTGVAGRVRPVVPGLTVDVQQQTGSTWTSVVQATLDPDGRFTAAVPPGQYRVRYSPGKGLSPGTSAIVQTG
jgi:hypothetical protein